ncbi:MAG: hypothetical protein RLY21_1, partial [Planctomycetota bacterium]
MPRRASYSLETVQALPAQAASASLDALRRQMLAAEALGEVKHQRGEVAHEF